MIKCFIDTETTGLNINAEHSVHQVAMILLDGKDEVIGEYDFKFKPFYRNYSEEALEKSNLTPELLFDRPNSSAAGFAEFKRVLEQYVDRFDSKDKMQFVGYNSTFDEDVIRAWYSHHKDNYYGSYFFNPSLCLYKTAGWYLREHRPSIPKFSLAAICEFAQIEFDEEEAHDALYDIRKTVELYRVLVTL